LRNFRENEPLKVFSVEPDHIDFHGRIPTWFETVKYVTASGNVVLSFEAVFLNIRTIARNLVSFYCACAPRQFAQMRCGFEYYNMQLLNLSNSRWLSITGRFNMAEA